MHIWQLSSDSNVRLFCSQLLDLGAITTTLGQRKTRFWIQWLFAIVLVLALQSRSASLPLHAEDGTEAQTPTSEILVGLRDPNLQTDQLRAASIGSELALLSEVGDVISIEAHDTRGTASVSCEDLSVAGLRLTIATADSDKTAAILAQHPDVLFAVPNAPVYAADRFLDGELLQQSIRQSAEESVDIRFAEEFEIDDPLYDEQRWYMEQINGTDALGQVIAATETDASTAVEPIVVAVIDSGIDADHPEFTGRLQQGYNFLRPTELPEDDYGHGTHVAGLIGAAVNNGLGIAGIAPNVTILSYKTLDQNGGGTIDNVVKAICRAVDDGADIINLSLTSPSPNTSQYTAAFDYATENGVMMIAAAGNSRQTRNMWPARLENVMAIAATNQEGNLASYSSPGDSIDLAAPGGEFDIPLISTWPSDVTCNGAFPNLDSAGGAYCDSIGTSMSAALVSGVAAILKGFHPEAEAEDIRSMLKGTAHPLGLSEESVGAGLLDAEKAVAGAMSSQLVVSPVFDSRTVFRSAPPYNIEVSIANPSFELLEWSIAEPNESWIDVSSEAGTTRFGSDANLTIMVKPQDLDPGNYGKPLTLIGKRPDGTLLFQNIQLLLHVNEEYDEKGQIIVNQEPESNQWFSATTQAEMETIAKFQNVGQENLLWEANIELENSSSTPWIEIDSAASGSLAFLESVQLQLKILPQYAATGVNNATVTLRGERGDGSIVTASSGITINIAPNTMLPLFIATPE